MHQRSENNKSGIVMTGGGARGAYQAGVISGLGSILEKMGEKTSIPFDILVGSSAGAINASYLASKANNFIGAANSLRALWQEIGFSHVLEFRTHQFFQLLRHVFKDYWLAHNTVNPAGIDHYLFDSVQLESLLKEHLIFENITGHIKDGTISALSIATTRYNQAGTVHFVQSGQPFAHWKRYHRYSKSADIQLQHVLASTAIPFFFPPQIIDNEYYGDGSIRNHHPISPAVHLGAKKILMVGVRNYSDEMRFVANTKPSMARLFSIILNSMFLDAVDSDLERLETGNKLHHKLDQSNHNFSHDVLRHIEPLHIHPSKNISEIAFKYIKRLPKSLQRILGVLGSCEEASGLLSYVMFDRDYCNELIELGYQDALNHKEAFQNFLSK